MKGKIAFVLGAAVGYVLGSRAGRQRYEQIKRGAQSVWNTEPVQKGVGLVKGAIDDRADEVKTFIRRASADAFANFARQAAPKERATGRASGTAGAEAPGAATAGDTKPEGAKSRATTSDAAKSSEADS